MRLLEAFSAASEERSSASSRWFCSAPSGRSRAPPRSSPVPPPARDRGSTRRQARRRFGSRWSRAPHGLWQRDEAPPVVHPFGRIARRPIDDLERGSSTASAITSRNCCALGRTRAPLSLPSAFAARAREHQPDQNPTDTTGVPNHAIAPSTSVSCGVRLLAGQQEGDGRSDAHDGRSQYGHELQSHQAGTAQQAAKKLYRNTREDDHAGGLCHQQHGVDEAGFGTRQHERIGRAVGAAAGPWARLRELAHKGQHQVQRDDQRSSAKEAGPPRSRVGLMGMQAPGRREAAPRTTPRPGRRCRARRPTTRPASWATTAPRRASTASRSGRPGAGTPHTGPPPSEPRSRVRAPWR